MGEKIYSIAIRVNYFNFALDSPLAVIPLFNNEWQHNLVFRNYCRIV